MALIAIIIGLLALGRYDYAQNVGIKACIWVVYTFLEMKYRLELSQYLRVFVMAIIINDSFAGLYLDLYTHSSVFDKIQHIFGGYAFSLFAYELICSITRPTISRAFKFLFVFSLGLGIGALYEIAEFLGDIVTNPRVPSQTSLLDTDLDLIADVIGALFAAVHTAIASKVISDR